MKVINSVKSSTWSHMEKQCITTATLSHATMQQGRVAQDKPMHYNSYFMLCHNATLESSKWSQMKKQ